MSTELKQKELNVPRILLEFLVYGEHDKDSKQSKKVMKVCNELQEQISKTRANRHKARILWYADGGEKTDAEKREWLINKAKCKYYVILRFDAEIDKNYVKDSLSKIKKFENAFQSLKSRHIFIAQKDKSTIENAIEVEN